MSALETWTNETTVVGTRLRVVPASHESLRGPLVAARRAARARMRRRRRRTLLVAASIVSLAVLMFPGHAFGGTGVGGVSADQLGVVGLTPGSVYVVQPGDTLASIARQVNPLDTAAAYRSLARELRSDAVVVGEHVLIP